MKPFWRVPELWTEPPRECFILGGGPSLRTADVDSLRGRHVIAVNQAYKLALWADALYFGDRTWLALNGSDLPSFHGFKITSAPEHLETPGIHVLRRRDRPIGISTDPTRLSWNGSSGAAAINLAYLMGARRIILLGFDMREVNGERNWHRDYKPRSGGPPYPKFLQPFPTMASELKTLGVEVLNASPDSALKVWSLVALADVLATAGAEETNHAV